MTDREQRKIGNLIEQKMLEFFGDPDSGLKLRKDFADEVKRRLQKKQVLVPHRHRRDVYK